MHLELNRSTDLALRALDRMGDADGRMKRSELAEAIGTSPDFVARVVGRLVSKGWVGSEPGRNGGYHLTAEPGSISVLDVIEAVEGLPDPDRCVLRGGPCGGTEVCAVHDPWTRAREALMKELAATAAVRNVEWMK